MKNELINYINIINDIPSIDLAELVGVKINMAQKYKRFENLPRLDSAILIEETYQIPARVWVDLKKQKDTKNV